MDKIISILAQANLVNIFSKNLFFELYFSIFREYSVNVLRYKFLKQQQTSLYITYKTFLAKEIL